MLTRKARKTDFTRIHFRRKDNNGLWLIILSPPILPIGKNRIIGLILEYFFRRITIPEAFLAADSIVRIMLNVFQGLQIHPHVISQHVKNELPFMATENIVIAVVNHGGNRQVKKEMVETGSPNTFIEKLEKDPYFEKILPELSAILDPQTFTGCAYVQVTDFVENYVQPVLEKYDCQLKSITPVALEIY